MEPSRRHTSQRASAADALTSLPAHLLDEILTRLDLRDAIRTSALSRAWRFRWESLPALALSFLDRPGTPPAVVDSVLVSYVGRISHFSFQVDPRSVSVDCWLIALSRRSVESIDLRSSSYIKFRLHSSIFSCGHLVSLELHRCLFPPLPAGFAGFPLLEELNLTDVRFVDHGEKQVEAIIRQSPLLQILELSSVVIPGEEWCVIQAPNLLSLTIISEDYHGWQIGELPHLRDATIDLATYVEEHDFGIFLAGVAHVTKLTSLRATNRTLVLIYWKDFRAPFTI